MLILQGLFLTTRLRAESYDGHADWGDTNYRSVLLLKSLGNGAGN